MLELLGLLAVTLLLSGVVGYVLAEIIAPEEKDFLP